MFRAITREFAPRSNMTAPRARRVTIGQELATGSTPVGQQGTGCAGYRGAVPYRWIRFLHIATAIGFAGIHGASIVVLYAIRNERDRVRIEGILDFSSQTAVAMYISLAAVIGTGLWMGIEVTAWFSQPWYWWSLILLALTTVLMLLIAKPFTKRIRAACEIRPSGVPRVSDEELGEVLRSPRTHLITAIGVIGLVAVLYLMVFKPVLWPS